MSESAKSIVYGWHAVTAALKNPHLHATTLYLATQRKRDSKAQAVIALAEPLHVNIIELPAAEFARKFADYAHQGVVLMAASYPSYSEADLPTLINNHEKVLLLILDGVTDPHNLGACLRTADAAGVTVVIAPKDRSVAITPTVRKVACGAAETVPFIQVTNLARTLTYLQQQGIWIYGTADEASQSLYHTQFPAKVALVLGAEGAGLRRLTREHCDALIAIPMHGSVSSLNVSVATGICLFEVVRQW